MKNPWKELIIKKKTFLIKDKNSLDKMKERVFFKRLLPEPYIGNPEAPIVILNLNPGYSETDFDFYKIKKIRSLWKKNITHKNTQSYFPFYFLDPSIRVYNGGPSYWRRIFRKIIEDTNLNLVAKNIFCVEYFPYHSKVYKKSFHVHSQEYSFFLVEKAIKNKALIVILRSEKLWYERVPKLKKYNKIIRLRNNRNVILSKNNIQKNGYLKILMILNK